MRAGWPWNWTTPICRDSTNRGMIHVAVTTASGQEVLCGSLGELLLRILSYLGVTLLAPAAPACITRRSPRSIRAFTLGTSDMACFDPQGVGQQPPGYRIHDAFSDACYRAFGGSYFYRLGSPLTSAVLHGLRSLGTRTARSQTRDDMKPEFKIPDSEKKRHRWASGGVSSYSPAASHRRANALLSHVPELYSHR